MAKDKILLDPNAFALAVIAGSNLTGDSERAIDKLGLKRYLGAYLLAEDFNHLEDKNFNGFTKEERETLLAELKPFDFNQLG